MFAQIFDKLISDSESVRTMFDQLFEFSIRHVKVMNAVTGRDDSSDISIEQLRSEKPTEPISYCPEFSIYTWDVEKVLKHIHDVFTEHKYPIYTFPIYLETHVEEIIKVGISDKPSNICLAALKYISANPYHVALRTLNVDSEVFRESIDKYEHLEEILDVMVSFNTKLMGTSETFKDKFIHSLQQIIKLQNTWEYIKMCNINNKLEGDKSIGEDRLFDIYGGDYSQIPKSTKIVETDIDMTTITQTDDKRVNSFIYQNFNRFCDLLESYGKTVYKVLNNSNEKDFTKEISSYNSKLDYYNLNSKSLKTMFTHISSIKDKHIVYGLKDVIDVIIYNYVPELRKLKFNKFFDESLAISMITSGSNSMLLGVALYIPSVKIYDQRTIQEEQPVKNKVITGGNVETDGVSSEILSAVNKFNEYSLSFTNSFLLNYKKIIEKLGMINWNTLKVKADTKYKNSFVLLRKLLIKKPETLSKLIDIDENENFNYDYTKTCNEFVSFVKNNYLNIYSNILDEVERISELLSDIHKKAVNFRNDTFNAKKNKIDYDYLLMHIIKLKRELNLKVKSEFDKEKFEEKINKIIKYTLSSISSLEYPYDTSKNKEKLEEYLSKIKDRENTIREYFETLRYDCKYSSQQLSPRVKNLIMTFCTAYNSLVSEYEKSYLWLNNEFDKFITKDRIKQMDKITLTSEQIKSIVSAAEQIDKYKPLNNIAEQFDNYTTSVLDSANIVDFYKCYQFIRNAYEEIGVLNYIEIIYKTLDIVDTSSKEWYTFKSNLLNFLTINSIWFDIYKLDGDKYILGSKIKYVDRKGEYLNKDYKFSELDRSKNNFEFFNIVNNIFSDKLFNDKDNIIYIYGANENDKYKLPLTYGNVEQIRNDIKDDIYKTKECCDVIRFLFEVIENMCINNKGSKFKFGYAINNNSVFRPFSKELDTKIFKALYVPIFQKINKYIILNKSDDENEIVDDKIMLTMLGGVKQYGSSVYDYSEPHKVEEIKFIESYLPVYVSCYSIINYYVSYLNDLMKNSKILNIDSIFKCSILNSIIDKTPEGFKIKEINVINVDKYLKFINDICAKNKKKEADLTQFAIESISSEFNSLLTLSKSLKPNELKSVDLYSEYDNLTNITEDIKGVIQNMRDLYINNGFNYSIEYKNVMQKLKDEMNVTSDKKAFFINCIEKLNGKHTNDTFNTKKVFMDLYYAPIEIVTSYWVKNIGDIQSFKGIKGVQDLLYKLYLRYGNKYHSLKELYTCVFDEFYKDLDECIHHVINYKNFNDKAVEETQLVHNDIKKLASEMKIEIDNNFKNIDYRIDDKMIPYVPFIGNPIVNKYQYYFNIYINNINGVTNHNISFNKTLNLDRITITDMIINYIALITQENTIPLRMVELLKNSELVNNTFKLFPISDKPLLWSNEFDEKTNTFQDDIIGTFSSVIIHKSLYNNDLGTDVNSQVYCNKLLSIINFSIQTLETMLNSLIPGKEYYNGYVHSLNYNKHIQDIIQNIQPFIQNLTNIIQKNQSNSGVENIKKVYKNAKNVIQIIKDNHIIKNNEINQIIQNAMTNILNTSDEDIDEIKKGDVQKYINNINNAIPFVLQIIKNKYNEVSKIQEQINSDVDGIIVPKINAKKEINILINILKELYSYYAPRAKECEFLGGNILTPDHYIVELIKIINEDSNSFKLHFMNNVEKYQWVIPTLKKLDYDIKYSDPFEKYFKNINNMDKLIEKKDHMHIMKILAKLILYKFLSIDNLFTIKDIHQIKTALMGGDDRDIIGELGKTYKFKDDNEEVDIGDISKISISKDIFNPMQYVYNDKVVMEKLNIKSDEDAFLFGNNEYITSKISQIIDSDDRYNIRRINVKCKCVVQNDDFDDDNKYKKYKTIKFNNGEKRSYYCNDGKYYEILFGYDKNSEKIKETNINNDKVSGEYDYNYKNIKDLYEHIISNGNNKDNPDFEIFINNLLDNQNVTINGYKFGMNKIYDNHGNILSNVFVNNDSVFDENMMKELIKDKLILETINKRKLWLVAICVLMLYSYYGVWKNGLIPQLKILSNKIINIYNNNYPDTVPCIFIDKLINDRSINCTLDNKNIEIFTYDLIELDVHNIPKISKLLSKDVVNPIYITPENNINGQYTIDMLNRFYAMLKLIFYTENGLKVIEIDEENDAGKNFIKKVSITVDKYITTVANSYGIYNETFDKLTAITDDNNKHKQIYHFIITSLHETIQTSNQDKNLYKKYVVVKTLLRIFKIYYSILLADNNLIKVAGDTYGNDGLSLTNFRKKTSCMFKLFNEIISKYKSILYNTHEDYKEKIKNVYNDNEIDSSKYKLIKDIYNINSKNEEDISKNEFNLKIISDNTKDDKKIPLDNTTISIIDIAKNGNEDNVQIILNKIYDIIKNGIDEDKYSDKIKNIQKNDWKEIIDSLIQQHNYTDKYKNLKDILKALEEENVNKENLQNEIQQLLKFNDADHKKYDAEIENINKFINDCITSNVSFVNAKEGLITKVNELISVFDIMVTYCIKYNIMHIIDIIVESRQNLSKYLIPLTKFNIPYDNMFNNNNNIKILNEVYEYLNQFDINDINASINKLNKNVLPSMSQSQIVLARRKLKILLSPKHIKSLKIIYNKNIQFMPDGMYLYLTNICKNNEYISLENNKFNYNKWKTDNASKWYLIGLSRNNIVVKTMIEILLESIDFNIYNTTYQLHPFNNNIPLIPFNTKNIDDVNKQLNKRETLIYALGDTYCDNNVYYLKHQNIDYSTFINIHANINSSKTVLLSLYLMMTYENPNSDTFIILNNIKKDNHADYLLTKLSNVYNANDYKQAQNSDDIDNHIQDNEIFKLDNLNKIKNILLNGNMSGGDLLLEDPNTILEKIVNEKHTIFDKYIYRYHSNIKNIILGHFANVLASYSNYLSGLTYYQILYSSEVFDTFVKNIRESFKNNNIKVQNSEISCIQHVINSLLSDELTNKVKIPMIRSTDTIGNETYDSNFIDEIIYPFINKRKFFNMKSKNETLLNKLKNYNSECLIHNMVDIEFYNMVVNCILIYIIKYVYKNKLEDDTISYIDNEVSL